jgi:hypothetical protein
MDIILQSGQSKIQIGGGSNTSGLINIGSVTTGYTNTISIANNSLIANILRIGSAVSNVQMQGIATFNNFLPSTTITTGFNNSNFTTKLFNDGIYATIANMSSYLTSSIAASTYQTIANMSSYLKPDSETIFLLNQNITNLGTYGLNQWVRLMFNEKSTVITASTSFSFLLGVNEIYMITTSNNITITLPTIENTQQLGVRMIFRRGFGQYSANTITFTTGSASQAVFASNNSYPATMGLNVYCITFIAMANTLNPYWAWYQC